MIWDALQNVPDHKQYNLTSFFKTFFYFSFQLISPIYRTEDRALSRKEILESVKDSLENLQLDYIDLVIIHKNDSHCPLEGIHFLKYIFICENMLKLKTRHIFEDA